MEFDMFVALMVKLLFCLFNKALESPLKVILSKVTDLTLLGVF